MFGLGEDIEDIEPLSSKIRDFLNENKHENLSGVAFFSDNFAKTVFIANAHASENSKLSQGEIQKLGVKTVPRAPACCKIGFKWYLFAFYDLKAILSPTVSPSFFAVTAFLVPAGPLEPRKLQNNDTRLRNRFRLRSVCGTVLEFGPSTAFTRRFLLQNELPRAKPLQMNDDC